MSLSPHFCREIGVVLIHIVVFTVGEKSHCLNRERHNIFCAFFVEPIHKSLLQPRQSFPYGLRSVREHKVSENALEIRLVEIAHVPENCLVASVSGRHIHRMYYLLEVVVNYVSESTLFCVQLDDGVNLSDIVVPIVLANEVIHIHKELRSGDCAHELRRKRVNEIDKFPAIRF